MITANYYSYPILRLNYFYIKSILYLFAGFSSDQLIGIVNDNLHKLKYTSMQYPICYDYV